MTPLLLILLMIVIFCTVHYVYKHFTIPGWISFAALGGFLVMILFSAYSDGRLGYEIMGLSAIILGLAGGQLVRKRKEAAYSANTASSATK
ncbi:MAG: hypothetical protein LAT84_10160 [Balneolia bacterium]|nr:hypothetical protein [Balneolia bacterium]